jgi:amidohydrolase
MTRVAQAKREAVTRVDGLAAELVGVAHRIHAHPEVAHHERRAAALLADAFERRGLQVERGAYGMPTAFAARAGPAGGAHVIVCCEYDALPDLGHACGHNVIAAAGLGAGLALAPLARRLGARLTVLGTPAEEGGGGKIVLADRGAFDGADAAMVVHPASYETVLPHINAVSTLDVAVTGRPAHASMYPDRGINALDALVMGYVGVAALRQHIRATDRVHGIFTDGGEAPNVVPAHAAGRFMVRSATEVELRALRRRVVACFQAGAVATGASLRARWVPPTYVEMRPSLPLAAAFEANLRVLGRRPIPPRELPVSIAGSTDMGNVSRRVPAIHPMLAISPPDAVPHTPEFARWARSSTADRALLDGARAMAMTALDVWLRPELRAAMAAAFAGPEKHVPGPASAGRGQPTRAAAASGRPGPRV